MKVLASPRNSMTNLTVLMGALMLRGSARRRTERVHCELVWVTNFQGVCAQRKGVGRESLRRLSLQKEFPPHVNEHGIISA